MLRHTLAVVSTAVCTLSSLQSLDIVCGLQLRRLVWPSPNDQETLVILEKSKDGLGADLID